MEPIARKFWSNGDGWTVHEIHVNGVRRFELIDADAKPYGNYGMLSWAIDASEEIDAMALRNAADAS